MATDETWQRAPLGQLTDHILATHHAYLHRQLPFVSQLLTDHVRQYWRIRPELLQAHTQFHQLKASLDQHLIQEETAAFPLIHAWEADPGKSLAPIVNTIDQHTALHADASQTLAQIRQTLRACVGQDGVGPEVAATVSLLDTLAEDLAQHIHLENDILFPRAREIAAA